MGRLEEREMTGEAEVGVMDCEGGEGARSQGDASRKPPESGKD